MSAWPNWRAGWRDVRLAPRIVGISVALLLLVQAVVFVFVRAGIETQAQAEIAKELATGERVWRRLLEQNAARLQQGAQLLASDYGFRTAVASGDRETAQSALENHGERIGSVLSAFFDARGTLVAHSPFPAWSLAPAQATATLQAVAQGLADPARTSALAFLGRTPYQFVLVPVRAPLVIGWVLMSFPIDQALADDLYRLFAVHVAVVGEVPGQPPAVIVGAGAAQPAHRQAALAALPPGQSALALDGERYLARAFRLESLNGSVGTVLLRSVDEVMAPFVRLQWLLGGITVLGVLLFALVNWGAMRRVTQPLRALTRAARALEQGEADVALAGTDRNDEVGRLARGFEAMRGSLARQQAEIRRMAFEDRLTELPNRARFRLALQQALDGRDAARPLAVLTLNLDRFKHINHVLGYAFGDAVLRAAAARLRETVDLPGGMLARLGGDEFCVLVPDADAAQALALAERLAAAFQAPLVLDEQTVDLSVGMGVAVWPGDGADADTLLGHAEIAMRAAKARAVGLLRYDAALDVASAQTLSLLGDLRQAIDRHELRLYLQPKIEVASGAVVAAEALVRWRHPQRGLVPPMQFIPFAEQTGFVRVLTRWMLEETARQWPVLQAACPRLRVAVNLSTRDLMDPDLAGWLDAWRRGHGIDPAAIGLEITESAIMDDPQRAEATLNRLADLGFRLAIDDFGTGYSSLAYLKRLPVQELKIDRSFVAGMERDADDATIVRSTIDLAHNLGLSVVAEGVENAAILTALRALGCDEAQGYHIARPMPVADWDAWCRARASGSPGAPGAPAASGTVPA